MIDFAHVFWDEDGDLEGNAAHIAEHDLTKDDVEDILRNPDSEGTSRSTGLPVVFGWTATGRYIIVAYELIKPDGVPPPRKPKRRKR
jgi:hypothetical protein